MVGCWTVERVKYTIMKLCNSILWRVLLASLLAAWKLGVNNYLCLNAIERIISWPSNKSFRTRHTQIPFFSFEIHGSPKMFVLTILFNLVREEVGYRNDWTPIFIATGCLRETGASSWTPTPTGPSSSSTTSNLSQHTYSGTGTVYRCKFGYRYNAGTGTVYRCRCRVQVQ